MAETEAAADPRHEPKFRQVRGQLSSFDTLPDEAEDDRLWAIAELNKRQRSAEDIRFDLNDRLAVKGCGPISRSAFNRTSLRLSAAAKRLNDAKFMFEGLGDQISAEKLHDNSVVIAEFIKLLIFELAQADAAERTPKEAMELARAYQSVIGAQATSATERTRLQREFAKETGAAVDKVTQAAGLGTETRDRIRAEILGIQK